MTAPRSRTLAIAVLFATVGGQSSATDAAASLQQICREAAAVVLPSRPVTESDVGRIRRASFQKVDLPRADGRMAVVLTGIRAEIERGGEVHEETQDLAYIEDSRCWDRRERGAGGIFECYRTDWPHGTYPTAIADSNTRAFLSVLAFLATGGASDSAAARVSSGEMQLVPMEIYTRTSAPSFIGTWYYCQTCGTAASPSFQPIATANLRFGRSANATYFLSPEGRVAKLQDGETRATYVTCRRS